MTKFKENMIAFIGAVLLTIIVIFVIIPTNKNLTTDILGTRKSIQNISDIYSMISGNNLIIKSNKNISNVASLSMEVIFDKSKVNISKDYIDSKYDISLAQKEGGNGFDVIIQNIGAIKKGNVILQIDNISKDNYVNINIGHIQLTDNNGNVMDLTFEKK